MGRSRPTKRLDLIRITSHDPNPVRLQNSLDRIQLLHFHLKAIQSKSEQSEIQSENLIRSNFFNSSKVGEDQIFHSKSSLYVYVYMFYLK